MTSRMAHGGLTRSSLLVGAAVAVVLVAAGVTAYAVMDRSDPDLARRAVEQAAAPDGHWRQTREVEGTAERDQYLARWTTSVAPGDEDTTCGSVATWLVSVTAGFQGDRVDGRSAPSEPRLRAWCLRALDRSDASSDAIGAGRDTTESGYQYGAYVIVRVGGGRPTVTATALARSTSSTGG